MTTDLKLGVTKIGSVDLGIDGKDQYVLVQNRDGDLTPEQAIEFIRPQVYRDGGGPGSYFCHTVLAVQAQYSSKAVICTIQHRYDI